MLVRKNVRSLTAPERQTFVNALLELKAKGKYDRFVHCLPARRDRSAAPRSGAGATGTGGSAAPGRA